MMTAAALVASPGRVAAQVVIDDFSTNQSALTLTYPPAGTQASSSVSGSGILGGERDLQIELNGGVIAGNRASATVSSGFFSYSQDATISANADLVWDGVDGSPALNLTGLGGVDLTQGASQDALLLSVFFDDLPVSIQVTVYTDSGHASIATINLPGLLFSSTSFVVPYSSFTNFIGTGADFSNVGCILMNIGSNTTAPDVVLDFFQTTALVTALETVAIVHDVNGDGHANPGDTLRYTVLVSNPTDALAATASGLAYASTIDPNATLVPGTVTTTQGTVTTGNTAGDSTVAVNLGSLADGATATITFDVLINSAVPAGVTQISGQGKVTGAGLTDLLTDDPGQPGATDPTVIALSAAPIVTAALSWGLSNDLNGNGLVNPGDTLTYGVLIHNGGNQTAQATSFSIPIDPNTTLVAGSVTNSAGTVISGNNPADTSVVVTLTDIGAGSDVAIGFKVTVKGSLPSNVSSITEQGQVAGNNFTTVETDDPTTRAANDPTVVPVAALALAQVPTLGGWGLLLLGALLSGVAVLRLRNAHAASGASRLS